MLYETMKLCRISMKGMEWSIGDVYPARSENK